MADMGIYSLWPVFTALNLGVPLSAEAWATHTCSIVDQVSRPVKNDFSYPTGCTIRFKFAARENMPAMDLFWYDGGMKPRLPDEIEAHGVEMAKEGILFVGDRGSILPGFRGTDPQRFAKGKKEPFWQEDDSPLRTGPARSPCGREHGRRLPRLSRRRLPGWMERGLLLPLPRWAQRTPRWMERRRPAWRYGGGRFRRELRPLSRRRLPWRLEHGIL